MPEQPRPTLLRFDLGVERSSTLFQARAGYEARRRGVNRVMDGREELKRRLNHYRALLKSTTDAEAVAAIEQEIRETRDRLQEIEEAQARRGSGQR